MKLYCDLYVSDILKKRKEKVVEKLKAGKCKPCIYVITLAPGERNHLEFYSSLLLKQHIYDENDLFVAGLAYRYRDALNMTQNIVNTVYQKTGGTDIRGYLLRRQREYEESRGIM